MGAEVQGLRTFCIKGSVYENRENTGFKVFLGVSKCIFGGFLLFWILQFVIQSRLLLGTV